jgi:hypothetical protein
MPDDIDPELVRRPVIGSQTGATGLGRLRSAGRVPPILSVALVGIVVGLLVGFGIGYRLGTPAPTPAPTPTPVPSDLQLDTVSSRLERAFESAAPGGWAVCSLGREVACRELVVGTTDPRVPPSEYGLGWYANRALTAATVSPGQLVLAASTGKGAAAAWVNRMGPNDVFLEVTGLTAVNPGQRGTFYFDLGTLAPGHYVIEVDFMAVPPAELAGVVRYFVVGFVVT